MSTTRHIPDLEAARECIDQAVTAVKSNDAPYVDQCVGAALKYLQPGLEDVGEHKDEPLYQVNIMLSGSEDPYMSKPLPKYDAENLMANISSLVTEGRGVIVVDIGAERLPIRLNARYIDSWFMTPKTKHNRPPF